LVPLALCMAALLAAGCFPGHESAPSPSPSPTVAQVAPTAPQDTPPPSPEPTPSPSLPTWMVAQQEAMAESARSDITTLQHLSRHEIDLAIGIESLNLGGSQTTTYTNNSTDTLREIYFNLFPNSSRFVASMEVGALAVDGIPLPFEYQKGGTVVRVPLPKPLPPGESTTLTLDFTARVPHVQKNYYLVFAMAQGVISLGDWHPMLAVYDHGGWNLDYPDGTIGEIVFSESVFYSVRVTLPQGLGLDVIATGVEAERILNADGTETVVYYSGPVRDFHLLISDRYQVVSTIVDDTTINSYYWPEHTACGKEALAFAERALTLFSEIFGEYPFAELDLAEADLWPWAIEWPGLILVGEPLYSDPAEECGEWHVVHEVAHQWWYSVVGNDQVDEPWLDEALANYSTALYYTRVHDSETAMAAIEEHINRRYEAYVQAYGDGIVGGPTRDYTRASYYPLVYAKGTLFFKTLRKEMGDEAFFHALQTYYRQLKYRVATPEGLLSIMEAAHGQPLGEFFQRGVFGTEGVSPWD
jgi:hypothetical protein